MAAFPIHYYPAATSLTKTASLRRGHVRGALASRGLRRYIGSRKSLRARLLFGQSARVPFRYGWFAIAKRHQGAHPISGLGYLVNRIEYGKIRRDCPV
jgi:hypothetical protein